MVTLKRYLDNAKVGMTKEKYLSMCETMGDTPDLDKMPPELDDFPTYVVKAIDVFNCLPDNYSGGMEPIYSGKDLASLSVLYSIFDIQSKEDQMRVLKVIQVLDTRARKQAIADAKKRANKKK